MAWLSALETQSTLDRLEADFSDHELFDVDHDSLIDTHLHYLSMVESSYWQCDSQALVKMGPRLKQTAAEFFDAFHGMAQTVERRHSREKAIRFLVNDMAIIDRVQMAQFSKITRIGDTEARFPEVKKKFEKDMRHLHSLGIPLAASSHDLLVHRFSSNLDWLWSH